MKAKIFLVMFILFSGLSIVKAQENIWAAGAGSNSVNEEYVYVGLYNGKPVYVNWDATRHIVWNWFGQNRWSLNDGVNEFYFMDANTYYPPAIGWSVSTNGTAPSPLLSGGVDPLPVELVSSNVTFNTEASNFNITWETATETNNYGFIVIAKQLRNNVEIKTIKSDLIKGAGNSNSTLNYSSKLDISDKVANDKFEITLKQIDNDGATEFHKIGEYIIENAEVIADYELTQNYPNPFNPRTKINYTIPQQGKVSLVVYNIIGKEVAMLVNTNQEAGSYTVDFDATNLASGTYLYRLEAENFIMTKKMLLLK